VGQTASPPPAQPYGAQHSRSCGAVSDLEGKDTYLPMDVRKCPSSLQPRNIHSLPVMIYHQIITAAEKNIGINTVYHPSRATKFRLDD
jgi:hypothetical protein